MGKLIKYLKSGDCVYLLDIDKPDNGRTAIVDFEIDRYYINRITKFQCAEGHYYEYDFAEGACDCDYEVPVSAGDKEAYSENLPTQIHLFATSKKALENEVRNCGFYLAPNADQLVEDPSIEEEILVQLQNLNAKASKMVDLLETLSQSVQ